MVNTSQTITWATPSNNTIWVDRPSWQANGTITTHLVADEIVGVLTYTNNDTNQTTSYDVVSATGVLL